MEDTLKRYFEKFGENYPLMIAGTKTNDEIIARINKCIETNKLEEEPEHDDEADY